MNILLTGANGLIGAAVRERLVADGCCVYTLQRRDSSLPFYWDPVGGLINLPVDTDVDVVIHLAGESIVGRWSKAKKTKIIDSRVRGTKLLFESVRKLEKAPALVICASAVGYYGDQSDSVITESSPKGKGFLADVCEQWEDAAHCLDSTGVRLVLARFGMVLSPGGGALKAVLPQFKIGLGGAVGTGDQYMSWVALADLVDIILFFMVNPDINGIVNVVAPNPVQNKEFAHELSAALNRPSLFVVPSFVVRLVLGQMGQELLLESSRVLPSKLEEYGFVFKYPKITALFAELFTR